MPDKVLFSQMFSWALGVKIKGNCVSSRCWQVGEGCPGRLGQTAGRCLSVPYPLEGVESYWCSCILCRAAEKLQLLSRDCLERKE